MTNKTIKIKDVAIVAGVSTATVSRALSKPEQVSEATRSAVLDAVRQTGYRINQTARNLRKQRSGVIAALIPDLGNPFFSQILSGMASELSKEGLSLIVVDSQQIGFEPAQMLEFLYMKQADGLIVLDGRIIVPHATAGGSRSPVVYACEWNSQADGSGVRVDNESGGRLAVEHLLALGHTDIGFVLGPQQNPLTGSRKDGALAALHQAGLNLPAHWALSGDFTLDSGAKAAQDWAALPVRPTAMFCMSDQMAFGFIAELTRLGYAVPDDVSVVGFDDIEIAHYFTPGLTTIRQPRFAVGCEAAKLLTCALQKEQKDEQASHTVLPVELIVRATTAAREGT